MNAQNLFRKQRLTVKTSFLTAGIFAICYVTGIGGAVSVSGSGGTGIPNQQALTLGCSYTVTPGEVVTGFTWRRVEGSSTVTIVTGSVSPQTSAFLDSWNNKGVFVGDYTPALDIKLPASHVTSSYAGTYRCEVSAVSGSVYADVTASVLNPPSISGLPPTQTVTEFANLRIDCSNYTTPGNPPTTSYRWTYGGSTVSTGAVLDRRNISRSQGGDYTCTASNSQGSDSDSVNVDVQYGPYKISLSPSTSSYTVKEHQALPSINCSALCRPGCNYRWLHNGTVISSGAVLQGQADRSKTGSYRCQPYNIHGSSDSVTVSVDVQYPADISMFTANSHHGSVTVNESNTVTLRCQIDSNPRSVIRLLNGAEEFTRADNSLTATYRLESADCRQRGNYTCTATNNIGEPVSQMVELLVQCSPRLDETVSQQLKYASRQGDDVTVSVSVLAYPLPTFTWSRIINTSQDLTGSSSPLSDISVTARLHLTKLQEQDFGDYSLTVDNGVDGPVSYKLNIVQQGPPTTPTNVSVSPIGPFTLHVSWKQEFNGGANQTFTVEYRTDENYWNIAGNHMETGSGKYLTSDINSLNSDTLYYVRVVAWNEFGSSNYTEHVTGHTEEKLDLASQTAVIVGVTVPFCVILLVLVAAGVFIIRRRRSKGDDTEGITSKGTGKNTTDNELEMQDNVCYASSDEVMKPGASGSQRVLEVYAAVDKKKLKPSEVKKPGNKTTKNQVAKNNKAKKAGSRDDLTPLKTRNKGKKGDVYENTGIGEKGNPHINHILEDQPESQVSAGAETGRNKDGLLYVGIDFSNHSPSQRVHREKESTEYAGIQIGVVGPALAEGGKKQEDKK